VAAAERAPLNWLARWQGEHDREKLVVEVAREVWGGV
jgi:hypothetical protein